MNVATKFPALDHIDPKFHEFIGWVMELTATVKGIHGMGLRQLDHTEFTSFEYDCMRVFNDKLLEIAKMAR